MIGPNYFENTALLLIDVQKGFTDPVWGIRNNPGAEENISRLLEFWRQTKRPIIHVQHLSVLPGSPLADGSTGCDFMDFSKPQSGETWIKKSVNSAFIGTNLETQLHEQGLKRILIVGFTTPHCVSTTARMAANLNFETFVVSDATVSFCLSGHDGHEFSAEDVHAITLATLNGEFATIVSTDEILCN